MNTQDHTLNTSNLTIGQELTMLKVRSNPWGRDKPTDFHTVTMTVTKILKNRLVLTDEAGNVFRLVVKFSKVYEYQNGVVTVDLEGTNRSGYNVPTFYKTLGTTDDALIAEKIAKLTASNARLNIQLEAEKALDAFKSSLTVENAEAAIAALQTFIANKENNA